MQKIIQYIVPAILAFVVGFLLWHIQKEKIFLDYEVIESASFPREGGAFGQYFVIRLRNNGNKQVNDTKLSVNFPSGTIESAIFSDNELIKNLSDTKESLGCDIPLLNPAEILKVTITTIGNPKTAPPQVVARAPGITAIPRKDDAIFSKLSSVVSAALIAALVTLVFSLVTLYRTTKITESIFQIENLGEVSQRLEKSEDDISSKLKLQTEEFKKEQERRELEYKKEQEKREKEQEKREKEHEQWQKQVEKEKTEQAQGKPTRAQLIFAIFNRSGLSDKFPILVGNVGDISFWRTGLFLMHSFLRDEPQQDNYIQAAELLLSLEMAPSSKGFVLYLLGKMEQFRKDNQKAIEWFDKCKNETPLMYEHLMTQNPGYDLKSVQRYLLSIGINPMFTTCKNNI